MANAITNLTLGYSGTDFKRTCALELADTIAAADSLDSFFLADDFDGTKGFFSGITNAEISVDNVTIISRGGI